MQNPLVIPAQAGIQTEFMKSSTGEGSVWTPAFAGVTGGAK
jgi:hypothetical protein